jgi:hypothetical protein
MENLDTAAALLVLDTAAAQVHLEAVCVAVNIICSL